jgi:hypothetical protein
MVAEQQHRIAVERRRAGVPPVDVERSDFLTEMPLPSTTKNVRSSARPVPAASARSPTAPDPCARRGWFPGLRTPVPICDVTKTRSPNTIGDDTPTPPSGARQTTFSVAFHVTGRFFSSVAPVPRGPRHWGRSAADSDAVRAIPNAQPSVGDFMTGV